MAKRNMAMLSQQQGGTIPESDSAAADETAELMRAVGAAAAVASPAPDQGAGGELAEKLERQRLRNGEPAKKSAAARSAATSAAADAAVAAPKPLVPPAAGAPAGAAEAAGPMTPDGSDDEVPSQACHINMQQQ